MKGEELDVPLTPRSSFGSLQRSVSVGDGSIPAVPMLCDTSSPPPSPSSRRQSRARAKARKPATHTIRDASPSASSRTSTRSCLRTTNEATQTTQYNKSLQAPPVVLSPPKRRFVPQTPPSMSYFSPQRRSSIASVTAIPEPTPSPSPLRRLLRASSAVAFNTPQSVKSTISRTFGAPLLAPLLQIPSPLASPRMAHRSSASSVASALSDLSATEIDSVATSQEAELLPEQILPNIMTKDKAHELLEKLQHISETQDKRDQELQQLIQQEKELAKARYLHGNETGAILAMKKIHRLQQERTRVTVASDVASDAFMDIKRALAEADVDAVSTVEIGEDNAYVLHEVQEVLTGRATVENDRQELLRQVRQLV